MRDELTPAVWRKSSRSSNQGQCVEVAQWPGGCVVRDSKHPSGTALRLTTAQWSAFTTGIRTGKFD